MKTTPKQKHVTDRKRPHRKRTRDYIEAYLQAWGEEQGVTVLQMEAATEKVELLSDAGLDAPILVFSWGVCSLFLPGDPRVYMMTPKAEETDLLYVSVLTRAIEQRDRPDVLAQLEQLASNPPTEEERAFAAQIKDLIEDERKERQQPKE